MPKTLLLSFLLGAASFAQAQGFDSRFDEGYTLLSAGNPDGALESFRQLLTEDPESEYVKYSIATAEYQKGLKALGDAASEEGVEQLYQARDGFDALRNTKDPFLLKNTSFNGANSTAQVAKHYDAHDQYNERLQALQDAIVAYEKVLRRQSDHMGAKTNLNHARYLLKSMMQDAPPEQQSEDDKDGEEDAEGENEQQSEEGENSEEGQEGEEEPPEGDEESDSENDSSGGDPQDASSQSQPLQDQNIEAILQSLEDKNREEQKNLRKAKGPPKVREGKWW